MVSPEKRPTRAIHTIGHVLPVDEMSCLARHGRIRKSTAIAHHHRSHPPRDAWPSLAALADVRKTRPLNDTASMVARQPQAPGP